MRKPRGFFRWKRRLWKSFHATKLQGWSPRFEGMLQLRLYTPDSMMYIVCVYPVYTYHMYIYDYICNTYSIYLYIDTTLQFTWWDSYEILIPTAHLRLAKKHGHFLLRQKTNAQLTYDFFLPYMAGQTLEQLREATKIDWTPARRGINQQAPTPNIWERKFHIMNHHIFIWMNQMIWQSLKDC